MTIILQVTNIGVSYQNRNFSQINGQPVVTYLIDRLKSDAECEIIITTSDQTEDDVFEQIADQEQVGIFRGNYKNVLERICGAVQQAGCRDFVRIFANYPLIDLVQMRELYQEHIDGRFDYSYNEHQQGVLWGTGCEVFSTDFIQRLNRENLNSMQRETISFYVRQNAATFRINKKCVCDKRPGYKLYLETEKDLEVIQELADNLREINDESISEYMAAHKVLSKYNLDAPAKEVGIEKLFLHPAKIQSLLNRQGYDMSYPISVEMTLTNTCNLKCVYCSDNELRTRQGRTAELDLDVIQRLFDDLSANGTSGVVLEGGGEPSLYTKFEQVVSYAREKGLALGLITNGTVRLQDELLKAFEWIRVSLDASTAEEYLELKGVDCFEKVLSNIAHYAQYCQTVGIGYVVTNKNISQIESLVMRLREIGAAYVQLRPVVDCEELYPKGVDLSFLKFYQNSSFGVIVDGMKENAHPGNGGLSCITNSITSIISGDGSVYLCGRLNIYDWLKPIGNINEQTFHEIWIGSERLKQLEMVHDGEFCKQNCPQCRVSKFNQLLERLENTKSKNFI